MGKRGPKKGSHQAPHQRKRKNPKNGSTSFKAGKGTAKRK